MKMKRLILAALFAVAAFQGIRADEGMWLPSLIAQRIDDMQAHGFRLTAEDVETISIIRNMRG